MAHRSPQYLARFVVRPALSNHNDIFVILQAKVNLLFLLFFDDAAALPASRLARAPY